MSVRRLNERRRVRGWRRGERVEIVVRRGRWMRWILRGRSGQIGLGVLGLLALRPTQCGVEIDDVGKR
jgi:hypothetical protein